MVSWVVHWFLAQSNSHPSPCLPSDDTKGLFVLCNCSFFSESLGAISFFLHLYFPLLEIQPTEGCCLTRYLHQAVGQQGDI